MGRITRMGPRITPITRISQFEFLRDHRVNLRALRGLKEFDFATNCTDYPDLKSACGRGWPRMAQITRMGPRIARNSQIEFSVTIV